MGLEEGGVVLDNLGGFQVFSFYPALIYKEGVIRGAAYSLAIT
jgi:hypothetical protein